MPSGKADFTVEIVDANGDPDHTVAVIDGIDGLSPAVGDTLFWDGSAWTDRPIADADIPAAIARDSELTTVANAALLKSRYALPGPGPTVGEYVAQYANAVTAVLPGNGTLYLSPIVLEREITIDRLSVNTTIIGSAGSLVRLGIYNDGGAGVPTSLLVDLGTVSTETLGECFKATSQVLHEGRWWLAGVQQGAPVTRATYTMASATGNIVPAGGLTTRTGGRYRTGVTGALPDPVTNGGALGAADNAAIMQVMARRSA